MRYVPIDNRLFIQNRRNFTAQMNPGSIAIFNANDNMPVNADGVHPFIQNTDLFYLSGIDQAETILVLFPDAVEEKKREILFVCKTDPKTEIWEGRKYSGQEAAVLSGISTVYWTSEFEQIFKPLCFEAEYIYLNTNEHTRADCIVETRDDRFRKRCQQQFPLHTYRRSAPIMQNLRMIKSSWEIDQIKKACQITGSGFEHILSILRPGKWEFEIEAEIYRQYLCRRSRGPAFAPIIACGYNACILHYTSNNARCCDGELVLMDMGAEYAHYAADVTRTVPVNGHFSERQAALYHAVLRIKDTAARMLIPGALLSECQKEIIKTVEQELIGLGLLTLQAIKNQKKDQPLYKQYFPHSVSHHLGLDVHDDAKAHQVLAPGMVLTCEPGIYIRKEKLGIRLEDDYLITEASPQNLTSDIPIEIDVIEEMISGNN